MIRCNNCGNVQESGKFCNACGLAIVQARKTAPVEKPGEEPGGKCPQCRFVSSARVCPQCGTRIPQPDD